MHFGLMATGKGDDDVRGRRHCIEETTSTEKDLTKEKLGSPKEAISTRKPNSSGKGLGGSGVYMSPM